MQSSCTIPIMTRMNHWIGNGYTNSTTIKWQHHHVHAYGFTIQPSSTITLTWLYLGRRQGLNHWYWQWIYQWQHHLIHRYGFIVQPSTYHHHINNALIGIATRMDQTAWNWRYKVPQSDGSIIEYFWDSDMDASKGSALDIQRYRPHLVHACGFIVQPSIIILLTMVLFG